MFPRPAVLQQLRRRLRSILPGGPVELGGELARVPDDLPPSLAAPVRVDALSGTWDRENERAEFRVVVRDADGKRCPNLAVEAQVTGPSRSASAEITTDLMGAALFRMADGLGSYAIEVLDVGAQGIDWAPELGAGTSASLEA